MLIAKHDEPLWSEAPYFVIGEHLAYHFEATENTVKVEADSRCIGRTCSRGGRFYQHFALGAGDEIVALQIQGGAGR